MSIKVEIIGQNALFDKLDGLPEKIRKIAVIEIDETLENIRTEAVNDAPVDDSFLKNSIYKASEGLNGYVGVGVKYGPYMEFGTGGAVDVPPGLEDYAIRFKGAGVRQINIHPHPFLFHNFYRETNELKVRLRKLINEALK